MKRGQAPITAFFQRKQVRRISIESVDSESDNDDVNTSASSTEQLNDPTESLRRNATARREARDDLTGILQRRELVGCASTRQLIRCGQGPRRRRKQQLVRWALTHFQRLPVELHLAPYWERQAGALSTENFYASCLEFDAQGVLLAVGASNGIIALYDFDDVFHRSLNFGQKVYNEEEAQTEEEEQKKMEDEILHPIHTIFTPFEVKCIRWNPLNEDEIACSFTNRNEIHIFDLRKFPSKPHKVLKSSNQPSCGYNDLLYLPAAESALSNSRQGGMKSKSRPKVINIIAGDMDGAIRMWDPRFPLRPMWSFLAGPHPINSLLLSPNKQFLICGNEAGILMTYDIQHKIVPAFGSKPVPQRKASFNIMEVIKPYLSPALIEYVLLSNRYGSPGIMSMHLVPHSETQVLCQLRNDWVVVMDYLHGSVVKLHTFIRGLTPKEKSKPGASPSVLSRTSESEYQRDFLPRSLRNSWLSCHRCAGAFLFDKSIMCTGIHDATSLNVIDLHQLRRIKTSASMQNEDTSEVDTAKPGNTGLPAVERLDRFRIPMNSIITAVAAHPNQHAVICGDPEESCAGMINEAMDIIKQPRYSNESWKLFASDSQSALHSVNSGIPIIASGVGSVSFLIGRGDNFVREKTVSSLIQINRIEEVRVLRKYTTSIGLRANYRVDDDPILRYTASTRPSGADGGNGVGESAKNYGLRVGNVADEEVAEYVLRLVVGRLGDSEQVFHALKSELDFSQAYTMYSKLKKLHDSRQRANVRLDHVEKLGRNGEHAGDPGVAAIINLMEQSTLSKASRTRALTQRLQPPIRNFESSIVDSLVDSASAGMAALGLRTTDNYNELVDVYGNSFCRMCYRYACHEHGGDHPLPARRVDPAYRLTLLAARTGDGARVVVSASSDQEDVVYLSDGGSAQQQRKGRQGDTRYVGALEPTANYAGRVAISHKEGPGVLR